MSHGSNGYIAGTDGRRVNVYKHMIDPIGGSPTLTGKPKIILVQGCRGVCIFQLGCHYLLVSMLFSYKIGL